MSDATVIIKVNDELKTAFAKAAKTVDRTTSQLLRDFMRDFVEQNQYDNWLNEKITKARKAVKEGHFQSNEEVEKIFTARKAKSTKQGN